MMCILKTNMKITKFAKFSLIYFMISEFNILKVILKSNSKSIKKKNHIYINVYLLNKKLHFV